jgi:hypothetical protein
MKRQQKLKKYLQLAQTKLRVLQVAKARMKYKNILYCRMGPLLLMVYTTHYPNHYASITQFWVSNGLPAGKKKILTHHTQLGLMSGMSLTHK